jgi:hypothetical protein
MVDSIVAASGLHRIRSSRWGLRVCPDAGTPDACDGAGMWDVLTWHNGTLAIAWWAILLFVFLVIATAGASAGRK